MADRESHDSFGLISFSRWTSSQRQSFFGSDIAHDRGITLSISSAVLDRNLSRDSYFEEEQILHAEMTEAQFAEMITTMNTGPGVPITLKMFRDGDVTRPTAPPIRAKGDMVIEEMKAAGVLGAAGLREQIKLLEEALGKTVRKGDLVKILGGLKDAAAQLDDHLPFMVDQFSHTVEKMVIDAKATIGAAVHPVGLEGMAPEPLLLEQLPDRKHKKDKKRKKKK